MFLVQIGLDCSCCNSPACSYLWREFAGYCACDRCVHCYRSYCDYSLIPLSVSVDVPKKRSTVAAERITSTMARLGLMSRVDRQFRKIQVPLWNITMVSLPVDTVLQFPLDYRLNAQSVWCSCKPILYHAPSSSQWFIVTWEFSDIHQCETAVHSYHRVSPSDIASLPRSLHHLGLESDWTNTISLIIFTFLLTISAIPVPATSAFSSLHLLSI